MSKPESEFDHAVQEAALRLLGLSDAKIVDAIVPIAEAFEEAFRRHNPTMSTEEIRALRDHFLSRVGDRVREIEAAGGSKGGTA